MFDPQKDPANPYAVLTGDTVFIGDVGRAGSLCGKQLSSDTVSSLGDQRRLNYALQPMSKEEFIRLVTADQPDAPPYFTYDAILNTRERATLDQNLEQVLHPVDLSEVLRMGDAGAQILDVRDSAEYAKGHLPGSINVGLGGQYATWAGTVLERAKPIVIVAEPGREQEAALRLGRIGFDHVKGYLVRDGSSGRTAGLGVADRTHQRSDGGRRAGRRGSAAVARMPAAIDERWPPAQCTARRRSRGISAMRSCR